MGRTDEDTEGNPRTVSHNPLMRDASRLPGCRSFLGDLWGILLSYPWDFALVFTPEAGRTIKLALEFVKRNSMLAEVSKDSAEGHFA